MFDFDERPAAPAAVSSWVQIDDQMGSLLEAVDAAGGLSAALAQLGREVGRELGDSFAEVSDAELVDRIVEEERLARVHAARRTRLVAELRRRRPGDERGVSQVDEALPISRWAPDELGCALGLSRLTAKSRLYEAARLESLFPGVLRAWEEGRIDEARARAVHDGTLCLPDELARAVEPLVLPDAPEQTAAQLRAAVREAVLRVDPEGANRRHRESRAARRVEVYSDEDGMAVLRAMLPATDAEAVWHMLTRLAKSLEDDRSLDQRRADLVGDLLLGRLTLTDLRQGEAEDPARPAASGTLVQVVVGLDTLTGASEEPAHLVGYGPIPADLAREAAADGVWRRLVTDPLSGVLLDHGRTTYRPPKALADFVRARDQVCRFPTCSRRAIDSELDHRHRWADGGHTSEPNLAGHCKHHNLLKERPGWRVLAHADGRLTWVAPTGYRRVSRPFDYRPFTAPRREVPPGPASDSGPPPF
ncbi:HNH endonuclease [Pseudonocardia pini]|uniref:HNH endonuclease n=1 Tax=Pseudonocardia pini TaxID=2758030 RepID=UPI0015F10F64|nr:HNH endonuclease signature motif containing protein [Pseudonocardia pini]